jgi:hypothetical protein
MCCRSMIRPIHAQSRLYRHYLWVQILVLAEEYDALSGGQHGPKMSPLQAAQELIKRARKSLRLAHNGWVHQGVRR